MNKYLTHSHILIMVGIILLVVYLFSFSWGKELWNSWTQYQILNRQLARVEQADQILQQQKEQLASLEKQASHLQSPTRHIPDHLALVEYLEESCSRNQVRIWALPQESRKDWEGYVLSTERLSLEGKLQDILQVVYHIEYTDQIASIQHIRLERHTQRQAGKVYHLLLAHIELKRLNHQQK